MSCFIPMNAESQHFFQVEPDCISSEVMIEDWDSIQKVSYQLRLHTALLGEVILPEEVEGELMRHAQKYFSMLLENSKIQFSILQEQTLCLAIIRISQTLVSDTEQEDSAMWRSIFYQLSSDTSMIDRKMQSLYKRFCSLLKNTIEDGKKIFAATGKVYYNTLTMHALVPTWSYEHLFEILYDFYAKNLNYEYTAQDGCYLQLVKKLVQRWSSRAGETEDANEDLTIELRADTLASSTKQLLMHRPRYMASICDSLVGQIDRLLKGETIDIQHIRWNYLLQQWFDKKSEHEKSRMKKATTRTKKDSAVTQKDKIQAYYSYNSTGISICLPRIRLAEISSRPNIEIYQNSRLIYKETTNVFGNALSYTTYPFQHLISENTKVRWSQSLNFAIKILCGETCVYDSQNSLYRQYILFHSSGQEIAYKRSMVDDVFLFTNSNTDIVVEDSCENYYQLNHPGKLFRISLSTTQSVIVASTDILTAIQGTDQIKAYFTHKPVEEAIVTNGNKDYTVFGQATTLSVHLSEGTSALHYQINKDGATCPLTQYVCDNGVFAIPLDDIPGHCHSLKLKDFQTGKVVLSYGYIILTDISVAFDKPYYCNENCDGIVTIQINGVKQAHNFTLDINQEHISIPLENNPYWCNLNVPKVSVYWINQNAFELPEYMWHKEITANNFLTVSCPANLKVVPLVDGRFLQAIRRGCVFEIGNYLQSKSSLPTTVAIELAVLEGNDVIDRVPLTTIVFEEWFSASPMQLDGKKIIWKPQSVFYGDKQSEFLVVLENDQGTSPWEYRETLKNDIVEKNFPCGDGVYHYQVVLCGKKTTFGKENDKILFEDSFAIGDPRKAEFRNNVIVLTNAHFWSAQTGCDEVIAIQANGAFLTDIEYEGHSVPDSMELEYPEYSGKLKFITPDGRQCYFNNRAYEDRFLYINPVRFWLAEGALLALTADDELLFVNTKNIQRLGTVQIVNSTQHISEREKQLYWSMVDLFEYEVISQMNFDKRGKIHECFSSN